MKKGDKIRRTGPDVLVTNPPVLKGHIYTIKSISGSIIELEESIGRHFFDAAFFEVINTPTIAYQIGDVFLTAYSSFIIVDYQPQTIGSYILQDTNSVGPNFAVSIYTDSALKLLTYSHHDSAKAALYKTNPLYRGTYSYTTPDPNISSKWTNFSENIVYSNTSSGKIVCECGSSKTYGENCNPEMHSSWCPRSKA